MIFTDVLFLTIFIYVLLFFGIPDITNDNYLIHKLLLFIAVFIFYYIVQLIKKIKNKCQINSREMLEKSLFVGLLTVIGYSVYVDLINMEWSKGYFEDIHTVNLYKRFAVVTLIIIVLLTLVMLIGLMFAVPTDECSQSESSI